MMQSYNELSECINLCNRILKRQVSDEQMEPFEYSVDQNERNQMAERLKELNHRSAFYPSRTIVVQNFLPETEAIVRGFMAMFGIMEICEIIRDDSPSWIAVIQFKSKASAADALLAVPYFKARGSHLVVHLLWNGPYKHIEAFTTTVHHTYPECIEKRVVCIGLLPRNITIEVIASRCQVFGTVQFVNIQPQTHGAFAFVTFHSPLSAAIATFCLRNKSTSSAALMLGNSEQGRPVLLGPVRVRPIDQYHSPLHFFDMRSIWDRFADYASLTGSFVNLSEKASRHILIVPGTESPCVRISTSHVKGVSLFIELQLIEGDIEDCDVPEDFNSISTHHKFLYRFAIDFGLHKPVLSYDEATKHTGNSQCIHWNSFFVLDLQVCTPWAFSDPILTPVIQVMNHIYSKINSKVFDDDHSSTWFGDPVRYAATKISGNQMSTSNGSTDLADHNSKMRLIMKENVPLIRLLGNLDGINGYKIPIHVYSGSVQNAF